jgi:membrane fusion protein, copper/silver efflux system
MTQLNKFLLIALLMLAAACGRNNNQDNREQQGKESDEVKTIHPVVKEVQIQISAKGVITYDPARLVSISSRYNGRIERLYVKYLYQPVIAGQKLFEIYSPEIVTAQNELEFLLKNDPSNLESLQALRNKLSLLGVTESQINDPERSGKISLSISVFSPVSGFIIGDDPSAVQSVNKSNNPMGSQPLENISESNAGKFSLREGSYVQQGEVLFRVAGNDRVRAVLQVFADEARLLEIGQEVEINPDHSDLYKGKIDFIEPVFRKESKTITARVYIDNPHGQLKIGQLIDARITGKSIKGLWIPKTALMDLGNSKVVLKRTAGGSFPAEVKTGISNENEILIYSGLSINDEIVKNIQYLIDSDAFIKDSLVWKK